MGKKEIHVIRVRSMIYALKILKDRNDINPEYIGHYTRKLTVPK